MSLIAFSLAVRRIQEFTQNLAAIEYLLKDIMERKQNEPKKYPREPLTPFALSEISNVKSSHQSVDCLTLN